MIEKHHWQNRSRFQNIVIRTPHGRTAISAMSEKRKFRATQDFGDALVRLLCGGFLPTIDNDDNWAYVRSWVSSPGTVDAMEIVTAVDGDTLQAIRVNRYGKLCWEPGRGRPREITDQLFDYGLTRSASRVVVGGWWWGRGTGTTDSIGVLHATFPIGPMPDTAVSLCMAPMRCYGPNRPKVDTPLCPSCCVAIVEYVIAAPQKSSDHSMDYVGWVQ